MDEARQILKLVTQAAAKIPGATRPVLVDLRDSGVNFGADFDYPATNCGFVARDAMGDPISFIIYAAGLHLAILAAYDGKLNEVGVGTVLKRQKARKLSASDVVDFTSNVLGLLEEGTKIAKAMEEVRVASTYDYNRG